MFLDLYLFVRDLVTILKLQTFLFVYYDEAIANFSHDITESIEQYTELTNKCNAQRKVFDLVNIVLGRKTVSSLLPQEKYAYYKNHNVSMSNEVLLQKEYLNGGDRKKS